MRKRKPAGPQAKKKWLTKAQHRWAQGKRMFLSTLDMRGRAKGVPVWFNFHEGVMYLVSMKDSVKVAKIRRNPLVRLRILKGPPGEMDAVAELIEDERLAWMLFRKKTRSTINFTVRRHRRIAVS